MFTALQRTNTENSKQIFPEKELRGHSPNFHIYALSEKWTSFYVLYSGGHKCNSLWGVSLRPGVTQI
jgi:hypothetical protein